MYFKITLIWNSKNFVGYNNRILLNIIYKVETYLYIKKFNHFVLTNNQTNFRRK